MRLFEAWRVCVLGWRYRDGSRMADTEDTRWAFYAGARHTLDALAEHLDATEEAEQIALKINDEIRDFGKVSLLKR